MLTAAAVIVGSAVILFDPIFQGLAISLMAGEVASLFLSRMTVPVLFYLSERKKYERQSFTKEILAPAEVAISTNPKGDAEPAHPVESSAHKVLSPAEVRELIEQGALVIDIRRPAEFAVAHIPGALNIILDHDFSHCATALLRPSLPLVFVAGDLDQINIAATKLAHLGIADVKGYLGGGVYAWEQANLPIETLPQISMNELRDIIDRNNLQIVDVRQPADYWRGHLPGSINIPIADLQANFSKLDAKRRLILISAEGAGSSTAGSLLLGKGFHELASVADGISAWIDAGLPVEESNIEAHFPTPQN
jgi:rhodanese-related sulfurtransferase